MNQTAELDCGGVAAPPIAPESKAAAKQAELRYVSDRTPGITREPNGSGFRYRDPSGKLIRDPDELGRIHRIAIPPAWTDVWICPRHDGHIQATGRDARGRKQYRYHPRWRSVRDENKYEHILRFGRALPAIRGRVEADLAREGLPREKVIAAVVRLMEHTLARVGNPEYARHNDSFGLTTLRNRHVRITRDSVELDFRAKHGIQHHSVVSDRKLARILKRCRDLPGSELFQYLDDEGNRHSIDSGDINDYLRAIAGYEISAKDFRTWAGTVLAAIALGGLKEPTPTKKASLAAVKEVAAHLGNTPAVCRKCDIHPLIIETYLDSSLRLGDLSDASNGDGAAVTLIERQVLRFLDQKIAAAAPKPTLKAALKQSLKAVRSKSARHKKRRAA